MHRALTAHLALVLLGVAGCGYRLHSPPVTYGDAAVLPLLQPSSDYERWYVPVHTEAGPWLLFLDTGYSYSTCDDGLIDALELETRGRVRVKGELGKVKVTKARLPPLTIGTHRVEGLTCQVRDLGSTSSISDPDEVPVAGVLGMEVLRRFRVILDPAEGTATLLPPRSVERLPRTGEGIVRMRRENWSGMRVLVPTLVEGRRTWPILDTGADATHVDGERMGLQPTRTRDNVTVRGTGTTPTETRTLSYYLVASVSLGGAATGALELTDRSRSKCTDPLLREGQGLLGLDVLGQFRQELDFRTHRARFTPVEPTPLQNWSRWTREEERLKPIRIEGATPR